MIIHAETHGNPTTATYGILAIHGAYQALQCWTEQDELANQNNVFITMDLPFHGATSIPESYKPQPDIWACSIHSVVEYFNIQDKPLFLIGWSFGAWCLKEYIKHYGSNTIAGIILVSGPLNVATFLPIIQPNIIDIMTTMDHPSALAMTSLEAAQQFVVKLRSQPTSLDEHYKTLGYNVTAVHQLQRVGSLFKLMETENIEEMERLYGELQNTPMLVITGADDAVLPSAELKEAIITKLPHASTYTVEHCGHSSFSEDPERFNTKVQEFITTSLYKGFP